MRKIRNRWMNLKNLEDERESRCLEMEIVMEFIQEVQKITGESSNLLINIITRIITTI